MQSPLLAAEQRTAVARAGLELSQKVKEAERQRFELGNSALVFDNLREQATADAALREIDVRLDDALRGTDELAAKLRKLLGCSQLG